LAAGSNAVAKFQIPESQILNRQTKVPKIEARIVVLSVAAISVWR
jgi:hypothetical protein